MCSPSCTRSLCACCRTLSALLSAFGWSSRYLARLSIVEARSARTGSSDANELTEGATSKSPELARGTFLGGRVTYPGGGSQPRGSGGPSYHFSPGKSLSSSSVGAGGVDDSTTWATSPAFVCSITITTGPLRATSTSFTNSSTPLEKWAGRPGIR
jgi:hypothetical protein